MFQQCFFPFLPSIFYNLAGLLQLYTLSCADDTFTFFISDFSGITRKSILNNWQAVSHIMLNALKGSATLACLVFILRAQTVLCGVVALCYQQQGATTLHNTVRALGINFYLFGDTRSNTPVTVYISILSKAKQKAFKIAFVYFSNRCNIYYLKFNKFNKI